LPDFSLSQRSSTGFIPAPKQNCCLLPHAVPGALVEKGSPGPRSRRTGTDRRLRAAAAQSSFLKYSAAPLSASDGTPGSSKRPASELALPWTEDLPPPAPAFAAAACAGLPRALSEPNSRQNAGPPGRIQRVCPPRVRALALRQVPAPYQVVANWCATTAAGILVRRATTGYCAILGVSMALHDAEATDSPARA